LAARIIARCYAAATSRNLANLREERRPAYAQAPIHVTSGNQPHQVTAVRILRAIDNWL
jgi:shikimate kinase